MLLDNIFRSLFGRSQRQAPLCPPENAGTYHWISNPWHAVSITARPGMCSKAKSCTHLRFLSTEAPVLPLEGCDAKACGCRYRHHDDRRESIRRASDLAASGAFWTASERRRSPGRRSTDTR